MKLGRITKGQLRRVRNKATIEVEPNDDYRALLKQFNDNEADIDQSTLIVQFTENEIIVRWESWA